MSNFKSNLTNTPQLLFNEQGKRQNQVEDAMKLVSTALMGLFLLICLVLIFEF